MIAEDDADADEATESTQTVKVGQDGDHPSDKCCIPNPDSSEGQKAAQETPPLSEHGKTDEEVQPKEETVTPEVKQCNQDNGKSLQTATPTEGKGRQSFINQLLVNRERLKMTKAFVDNAVKMHKVFSIQGYHPFIRAAFRARGWVEQCMQRPKRHAHGYHHTKRVDCSGASGSDDDDDADNPKKGQEPNGLHIIMSRQVRNEKVYFYWTNNRNATNTMILQKDQLTNHFTKAASMTTKVGLCMNLMNTHWFHSVNPDTFFPRCHILGAQDEKHAIIEDYRRTACISILKYIVERTQGVQGEGPSYNIQNHWKKDESQYRPVALSQMIVNTLKVCQEFLDSLEHRDIDIISGTPLTLTEEEWEELISSYCLIVHDGVQIDNCDHAVSNCKSMLQRLEEVCPQLDIDGIHNIWIIKPGAQSRGRGIKCVKRLDEILRAADGDSSHTGGTWVVQKYLERPLLVHGTKFDVRQWFLVTNWFPLTVWFYKKCYLRFSTQPYSLDILDKSVHLCNNSIQRYLRPSEQRNEAIPADNMWSDEQFKTFLSSQGWESQWQTVVVPGMKKAIICALQTTRDQMEPHSNSFELYGADFMIGRDLRPWLIEVNASPSMDPSTPVTAHLCPAMQEDILRVVLDYRADRSASTGDFQLIYREAAIDVPMYGGLHLSVEGHKIKCPTHPPRKSSRKSAPKCQGPTKEKGMASNAIKTVPKILKRAKPQRKNTSRGVQTPPPPPPKVFLSSENCIPQKGTGSQSDSKCLQKRRPKEKSSQRKTNYVP